MSRRYILFTAIDIFTRLYREKIDFKYNSNVNICRMYLKTLLKENQVAIHNIYLKYIWIMLEIYLTFAENDVGDIS